MVPRVGRPALTLTMNQQTIINKSTKTKKLRTFFGNLGIFLIFFCCKFWVVIIYNVENVVMKVCVKYKSKPIDSKWDITILKTFTKTWQNDRQRKSESLVDKNTPNFKKTKHDFPSIVFEYSIQESMGRIKYLSLTFLV